MTDNEATAARNYDSAFVAHQIIRAKYRSMEIDDAAYLASAKTLKIARTAHEAILFGGTDNECNA